jgi:FixJ family two-component response regulator
MVTVAIVDDDPSVRTGLERLFSAWGYQVSLFASAEEFLTRLPQGCPDCLILDRQMGGMSGDQLLVELSAEGIQIPTVVISGLVEDNHPIHQTPPSGNLVVRLGKPFSAAAIFGAVDTVLGKERPPS